MPVNKEYNKEYYTVDEMAKIFAIAPITIYKWIWSGKLPAYKLGRLVRIKKQDMENMLKKVNPKEGG